MGKRPRKCCGWAIFIFKRFLFYSLLIMYFIQFGLEITEMIENFGSEADWLDYDCYAKTVVSSPNFKFAVAWVYIAAPAYSVYNKRALNTDNMEGVKWYIDF